MALGESQAPGETSKEAVAGLQLARRAMCRLGRWRGSDMIIIAMRSALPAALALVLALVTACASGSPTVTPSYQGGPRLLVDHEVADLGVVSPGVVVEHAFKITNGGDAPLQIGDVVARVEEGCCPPTIRLGQSDLPPGRSTTAAFTFSMGSGMEYPHAFQVLIPSNDPVEPVKTLRIVASIAASQ
ncbi:MAG: DUF1573 domain-containing protein [Chloroflexi bacterium]|nr:DUF1573 domain-containing protein [Chloroflexota bacterium]